jgi:hypothetical protein
MAKVSKATRAKVEKHIYSALDIYDKSGMNTEKYKKFFASLSDDEFYKWAQKPYPIVLYLSLYKTNIMMEDILDALKFIKVPYIEKIYDPAVYQEEGKVLTSKNCAVIYLHMKRESQMTSKKNAMSTDIASRDMNTGLLLGEDKNGKMTDRENESLIVNGLEYTYREFGYPRADNMDSKNDMYNIIGTTGRVTQAELNMRKSESLATGIIDAYLVGAGLKSNLKADDYILPYTLEQENK